MIRDSLDAAAPFAAVVLTPGAARPFSTAPRQALRPDKPAPQGSRPPTGSSWSATATSWTATSPRRAGWQLAACRDGERADGTHRGRRAMDDGRHRRVAQHIYVRQRRRHAGGSGRRRPGRGQRLLTGQRLRGPDETGPRLHVPGAARSGGQRGRQRLADGGLRGHLPGRLRRHGQGV